MMPSERPMLAPMGSLPNAAPSPAPLVIPSFETVAASMVVSALCCPTRFVNHRLYSFV